MNKELIEMAKQAGWEYAHDNSGYEPLWKFAALVAAAEREACAKVCDDFQAQWLEVPTPKRPGYELAKAIRARGETK